MEQKSFEVGIEVGIDPRQLPDPIAASMFGLSRFGGDVSLLVGHLNIPRIMSDVSRAEKAAEPPKSVKVPIKVTHQFFLSLHGFAMLRKTVNDFARNLEAQNIKLPDPTQVGTENE